MIEGPESVSIPENDQTTEDPENRIEEFLLAKAAASEHFMREVERVFAEAIEGSASGESALLEDITIHMEEIIKQLESGEHEDQGLMSPGNWSEGQYDYHAEEGLPLTEIAHEASEEICNLIYNTAHAAGYDPMHVMDNRDLVQMAQETRVEMGLIHRPESEWGEGPEDNSHGTHIPLQTQAQAQREIPKIQVAPTDEKVQNAQAEEKEQPARPARPKEPAKETLEIPEDGLAPGREARTEEPPKPPQPVKPPKEIAKPTPPKKQKTDHRAHSKKPENRSPLPKKAPAARPGAEKHHMPKQKNAKPQAPKSEVVSVKALQQNLQEAQSRLEFTQDMVRRVAGASRKGVSIAKFLVILNDEARVAAEEVKQIEIAVNVIGGMKAGAFPNMADLSRAQKGRAKAKVAEGRKARRKAKAARKAAGKTGAKTGAKSAKKGGRGGAPGPRLGNTVAAYIKNQGGMANTAELKKHAQAKGCPVEAGESDERFVERLKATTLFKNNQMKVDGNNWSLK